MESGRVIKGLDVIKENGLSMFQIDGNLAVEALGFERGPEAFHRGVIVAAGLAAHAKSDLVGEQELTEST